MSNPTEPSFWDSRYKTGQTPWNFGGVPMDVKEYVKRNPKGGRVLIPGCGWGYEIQTFADAGYEVTAMDLSPAAVERAHKLVNPDLAKRIVVGDFFRHNFGPNLFDVVYERTFLCAVLPEQRAAYRDRMTRLLKYGGALVGYFYYEKTDQAGEPPFGLAWGEADELFARHFLLVKDTPVTDSLPVFAGRERWQERAALRFRVRPTRFEAAGGSMENATLYEQLVALERDGTACVLVVLVEALGSTPQDSGAKMLVTSAGLHTGTVGGGKVEAKAILLAQQLLARAADPAPHFVSWTLKTDVGMTCGGAVKLYFEPHLAGGRDAAWPIWIFGAGHVVQALVPVLAPLDCTLTVVDPRREWLDRLPRARNARYLQHDRPADLVPTMPDNAFLLCLTKGHASDRPVLQRALAERNFSYVGVIGSNSKAEVLRREMRADGLAPARAQEFHCPVGLAFGTNHPHEIALSIAAQLVMERDRLKRSDQR